MRTRISSWTFLLAGLSVLLLGCLRREVQESQPQVSSTYIKPLIRTPIQQLDLLFVVDNSASMGDKQAIFGQAVPRMLERLIFPDCVRRDEQGAIFDRERSVPSATPGRRPSCETGWGLEFEPIFDIHIGVITSSLGGHGSSECRDGTKNDRALLLPKVRTGLPDPHGTGFLVWHPPRDGDPPATHVQDDFAELTEHFRAHVLAAGEDGCGFEAPLEAWYRFLVDPSPPQELMELRDDKHGFKTQVRAQGVDQELLKQRAEFLRPDSLVAIVLLSDENDCSAMEGGVRYPYAGYGWMLSEHREPILGAKGFPPATAPCQDNPNDPCCFSCFLDELPRGCDDPGALSSCGDVADSRLPAEDDRPGTRCFDNQRRFGIDLLYPVERYVEGLSSPSFVDAQTGQTTHNPLLMGMDGKSPRRPGLVFFAGITGVPYQDILRPELSGPNQLSYLPVQELADEVEGLPGITRWDLILGEPGKAPSWSACHADNPLCGAPPTPPLDPFMIESIEPRRGVHPLLGIAPTIYPDWNDINGNEQDNGIAYSLAGGTGHHPAHDDLQYSCIFPLEPYGAVEACDPSGADSSCDCGLEPNKNRPLCRADAHAPAAPTQHFGKAYPAPRVLQVLRGFGQNSILASICPKVHDPTEKDYGFNPAVTAIVDRLATRLNGQCLPRPLVVSDEGLVECKVLEAVPAGDVPADCVAAGRLAITDKVRSAARRELATGGFCQGSECERMTVCEIPQHAQGVPREACLFAAQGSEAELPPGYCYVDPTAGWGSASLVATCPSTERRILRFVGEGTPQEGAVTLVACAGGSGVYESTIGPASP